MTIALIAKDEVPLAPIGEHLTREGAGHVSVIRLHEILDAGQTAAQADLVFVISTSQDFATAGGAVNHVRQRLGDKQRLVLCITPCPFNDQRLRLLNSGADEIISPAGSTPEQIGERILGHLILNRRVTPYSFGQVLGATRPMREVYDKIRKYAPLEFPILLRGETGTGKGFVANEVHEEGQRQTRRRGKFVHLNCNALNAGLLEEELFGHLKGAFTGALSDRKGLIEEAQNGTVFIDEIGDFEPGLQTKLLDVVENNRVRPLGANLYRRVEARFVFATHRELEKLVEQGDFREDLFARINVLPLELPPLRRRKADIPLLVEHFISLFNRKYNRRVKLGDGAVDDLFLYDWRLNVRGLSSVVFRAAAGVGSDETITGFILSERDREPAPTGAGDVGQTRRVVSIEINPLVDSWAAVQAKFKEAYFRALAAVSTNKEHAARLARMGRSQVFEKFKEFDLHCEGESPPGIE